MVTNEKLVGHIAFRTTVAPAQPVALPGLVANDSTAYDASVTRDGNTVGRYLVRVGEALAPPRDESLDASVSSSLTPGNAWTNVTVTERQDLVVGPSFDRFYQLDVVDNTGVGGLVIPSDIANVIVRFSAKRVNPRRT